MELVEVLNKAMTLEKDGRSFYLKAAELTTDAGIQAMFRQLAEDESHHYEYLERQLVAIQCGEDVCALPDIEDIAPIDLRDPIFPSGVEAIEDLAEDADLEDALVFAMGVEDKSFKLYREAAEEIAEPEAKQLFRQLAAVELGHFETLMQRYESFYHYPR